MALLAFCLLAGWASAGDDSPRTGSAPVWAQPSLVPPEDEVRKRRDAEERRRMSPEARAERERSRTAYRGLSDAEAIDVARRKFPLFVRDRAYRGLNLRPGERAVGFIDDYSAVVDHGDGRKPGIVESTLPMRVRADDGATQLADLSLVRDGIGFRPAVPFAEVRFPDRLSAGIRLPRSGLGVIAEAGGDDEATLVQNKLFYANLGEGSASDTDLIAEAVPAGAEVSLQLRSADSPEAHRLRLEVPRGGELRRAGPPFGGLEVLVDDRPVASVSRPIAWDADQQPVPVSYRLDGHDLVISVDHRDRDVAYPVLVDPTFVEHQSQATDTTGWRYAEDDPYNSIGASGDGASGRGLYVFQSPGAGQWNWGQWYFPAPGHSFIYRFEHLTTHAAEHTTAQLGVVGGPGWEANRWYQGANTGLLSGSTEWSWGYGRFYLVQCLSVSAPCGAYEMQNGQVTGTAGYHGNAAVIRQMKNALAWAASWPYLWAGETKVFLQDDTPPSVSLTAQSAPAGWVDNASPSVTASASDSGFGVERIRLNRGGAVLQDQEFSCPRARPQRCEPHRSTSFGYSTAAFPEGINTLSVTAGDWEPPYVPDPPAANLRNWSNPASSSWQIKLDRSAPRIDVTSGALWNRRNQVNDRRQEGLYDPTAALHVEATDDYSGARSIEIYVDGVSQRSRGGYVTSDCPAAGGCRRTLDWTLRPDDYSDGDHIIRIIARDQLADPNTSSAGPHAATKEFQVTVDRRGDIYRARVYDAAPAAGGTEQASEWARLGTLISRREDPDSIATRTSRYCNDESGARCDEVRFRTRYSDTNPAAGETYASEIGASETDSRLDIPAEILRPGAEELGAPVSTGVLSSAIEPWQRPPPNAGAEYGLYEITEYRREAEDNTEGSSILRVWLDQRTRLPVRQQTLVDGSIVDDTRYSYDPGRLESSQVPEDHFRLSRPSNVTDENHEDYRGAPEPSESQTSSSADPELLDVAVSVRRSFGLSTDETLIASLLADPDSPGRDEFSTPLTASEYIEMLTRRSMQASLEPLRTYLRTTAASVSGGLFINHAAGGLVQVGFTDNPESHRAAIETAFPYPDRLRLVSVAKTETELAATMSQIDDDTATLDLAGIEMTYLMKKIATNEVLVGVRGNETLATWTLRARYGLHVRAVQDELDQVGGNDSHRRATFGPLLTAGLAINRPHHGPCTSGFDVKDKDRARYFLLTAGHCGGVGSVWHHGGRAFGRLVKDGERLPSRIDAAIISMSARLRVPWVFLYEDRNSRVTVRTIRTVPTASEDDEGDIVCISGIARGYRCGTLTSNDALPRGGHDMRVTDIPARPSESGSPVLHRNAALGIVWGSTRGDGHAVYSHIDDIQQDFGIRVLTPANSGGR